MSVTIKDLAEQLNLSIATVSKVSKCGAKKSMIFPSIMKPVITAPVPSPARSPTPLPMRPVTRAFSTRLQKILLEETPLTFNRPISRLLSVATRKLEVMVRYQQRRNTGKERAPKVTLALCAQDQ